MFQVVVVPPDEVVAALEPFRRLHDPAFHRHAPHVALTPPFEAGDADGLLRRFTAFRAPSVLVTFDDARPDGAALLLHVRDEAGKLAALQTSLRDTVLPLGARVGTGLHPPSIRIGVIAGDAERELARRAFAATVERLPAFVARDVALLVEDVRGLWHEVRRVTLTPPGA